MFKFERELPVHKQIEQLRAYCALLEKEIIAISFNVSCRKFTDGITASDYPYDLAVKGIDVITDISNVPGNMSLENIDLCKRAIKAFQELESKRDFLSKLIEKEQADSKELLEDYDKAIISFNKLNGLEIKEKDHSFHILNRVKFLFNQCRDSEKSNEKESFMFYFVALIRQLEDIGINVE